MRLRRLEGSSAAGFSLVGACERSGVTTVALVAKKARDEMPPKPNSRGMSSVGRSGTE